MVKRFKMCCKKIVLICYVFGSFFFSQASTKGQAVFDRLLKACKDVSWKGESIIVLDSIQVDPPYAQENCKLLQGGSGKGSLERVQKIVSA